MAWLQFEKYAVYICLCQKIYIRISKGAKKSLKDNLKWKIPSVKEAIEQAMTSELGEIIQKNYNCYDDSN